MGAVGFIGPEDSCQTEAVMAAAQNLPMISFVSTVCFAVGNGIRPVEIECPVIVSLAKFAKFLCCHSHWPRASFLGGAPAKTIVHDSGMID